MPPITLDGTRGITTPTYNGSTTAEYLVPVTGFKNRLINGDMTIDQRNAGASITPTASVYTLDRWSVAVSASSKLSVQQNAGAVTPPAGFSNYLGITSTSAYSVTSGDYFAFQQTVEGYNIADLGWGTANAKTVTLSFWVRSSLTGTFGGSLNNGSRSYPYTYTISSANTWEQKTITIAGDTSGTYNFTNGTGVQVWFGLGVGSTYSGTAGSWSANNYLSATGATSVVGTNGATFYITGVQLEVGSNATSFDYLPYGTELALCQRYYWQAATGATKELTSGWYYNSTQVSLVMNMPVPMRTGPTISQTTGTDYYTIFRSGVGDGFNSLTIEIAGQTMVSLFNESQVSGTAGQTGLIRTSNASSSLGFNAEL